MLLRPASSVIRMRWRLPTTSGLMCSYSDDLRFTALTCTPPLWAKADRPTYGWRLNGGMLATSET